MPEYNLKSAGSLQSIFTPAIVSDVCLHMRKVLESGGRLRTVKKRKGISKAFHGAKVALGINSFSKDLYLWHSEKTIVGGRWDGYLRIDDLAPYPGVPNWKVYYHVLLMGEESDYSKTKDKLKGHSTGDPNTVTVDQDGDTIEVTFNMSGLAFLRCINNHGKGMVDTFKAQIREKWGNHVGNLLGTPGGGGGKKTSATEGYAYIRCIKGRQVCHTGGVDGEWIGLHAGSDWENRYRNCVTTGARISDRRI